MRTMTESSSRADLFAAIRRDLTQLKWMLAFNVVLLLILLALL
jgi:hypothetical protein